jgi:hypothetical protein
VLPGLSWDSRAVSSVGRAPALQAGGRWFEPGTAHFSPFGRKWRSPRRKPWASPNQMVPAATRGDGQRRKGGRGWQALRAKNGEAHGGSHGRARTRRCRPRPEARARGAKEGVAPARGSRAPPPPRAADRAPADGPCGLTLSRPPPHAQRPVRKPRAGCRPTQRMKAPLTRVFSSLWQTRDPANECVKRARRPLGASLNKQRRFSRRNVSQVVRGPCGSREMLPTTCPVSLSLPWRATSACETTPTRRSSAVTAMRRT